jgi:hypothetical protein
LYIFADTTREGFEPVLFIHQVVTLLSKGGCLGADIAKGGMKR